MQVLTTIDINLIGAQDWIVQNILSHVACYKNFLIGLIFNLGAAIGGTTGHLLEQNAQVIVQIRSNLAAMKVCTQISASF